MPQVRSLYEVRRRIIPAHIDTRPFLAVLLRSRGEGEAMKTTKAVLSETQVCCPCCGYALRVGATVRIKATREIGPQQMLDSNQASAVAAMVEEAERHG